MPIETYSKRKVVRQGGSLMVSIPSELKHVFKEGLSLTPICEGNKLTYVLEGFIPQKTQQPKPAVERKVDPLPFSHPEARLEQQIIPEPQLIPEQQKDPVQKGVEVLVGDIMDRILGKPKEKNENEEEII